MREAATKPDARTQRLEALFINQLAAKLILIDQYTVSVVYPGEIRISMMYWVATLVRAYSTRHRHRADGIVRCFSPLDAACPPFNIRMEAAEGNEPADALQEVRWTYSAVRTAY